MVESGKSNGRSDVVDYPRGAIVDMLGVAAAIDARRQGSRDAATGEARQ